MKTNESVLDRMVRLIIAGLAVILVTTNVITGTAAVATIVVAAIAAITGIVGFCGLYSLLGVSTCPIKNQTKR